jgi:hypothetical protein
MHIFHSIPRLSHRAMLTHSPAAFAASGACSSGKAPVIREAKAVGFRSNRAATNNRT